MRIAGGVSAAVAAAGAVVMASPPTARADVSPGTGSAYAQALQATPHDGSLAVGVILGEALAGHTNTLARAQSQGLDLGSVGLALESYNCGSAPAPTQKALVPQPLQTETGAPGANQGVEQDPSTGLSSTSPSSLPPSFGSTEIVKANGTPYGEADTSYGQIQVPGLPLSFSGMTSRAWSGIVGGQREAGATVDIKQLNLLDGTLVLSGLHWQVLYPSGGSAEPSGSFSVGQLVVGGQSVTAPDTGALTSLVNTVLGTLGIQIVTPTVTTQQGVEYVTPLQIDVVPNQARDQLLQALVNGQAPLTSPLLSGLENGFGPPEPDQLAQLLCQSDTPITVAEISVASVDGGGYFTLALGGVNASSGEIPSNPYNLDLTALGSGGATEFVPGTSAVPGISETPASTGSALTPSQSPFLSAPSGLPSSPTPHTLPGASTATAAAPQRASLASAGFAPGGPLLGVGLGALGLLALLAEADRRMMRRAQHNQTFEE